MYSEIWSLHLTYPGRAGQPEHGTKGPTPDSEPVPWSRVLIEDTHNMLVFDGGGNRGTWRKPTQTQEEHVNSTQKGPAPARNQTHDFLAMGLQCLPLIHCAIL